MIALKQRIFVGHLERVGPNISVLYIHKECDTRSVKPLAYRFPRTLLSENNLEALFLQIFATRVLK
ncbi:MAG: hypothetical protein HC862_28025 [Scytonema sp. RU_4_4]|nr:hypothetical protein [Scytonema sp. RU_4_4]NJR75476.1 hypothetical protein [Scytonema sp. CRU_2_7]